MSFPASWRCFYCTNPINDRGVHVYARIGHHYANGDERLSDRRFHSPCFGKFRTPPVGRPWNPNTEYEVVAHEVVLPALADV
jgi:ParB/Sulfiredoxin domain